MKVQFGDVSVDVEFTRDNSGNWHFAYEIPNYRGSGETMRIVSDMEFESESAAQKHARLAVKVDLERNQTEIKKERQKIGNCK
jgi:hypothetical protein